MVGSVPAWTTEQVLVGREGDRKDDKQKGKKRREDEGKLVPHEGGNELFAISKLKMKCKLDKISVPRVH